MPNRKTTPFAKGAGMTAGLEIHWLGEKQKFVLVDTSSDARFQEDVAIWSAAVGLRPRTQTKIK
jgi:hypothetical protein